MYTVKSILTKVTDSELVFQNVMETLRTVDPSFEDEHRQYLHSVDTLMNSLRTEDSTKVMGYIAAKENAFCSEMIYIAWLGFQQNIACFRNPINTEFLKLDYETIHRENSFQFLPKIHRALSEINDFDCALRSLPEDIQNTAMEITDFFSYLETVGFKLAHYFGFAFADRFLGHVVPGYAPDSAIVNGLSPVPTCSIENCPRYCSTRNSISALA